VYDVIWTAPHFNVNGSLQSPALVTVLLNGVLVQNNFSLKGRTEYIGQQNMIRMVQLQYMVIRVSQFRIAIFG
jgi:hypothetical protein